MGATRFAPNGMVVSVDHLASEAGVAMLRAGGSAADAAVAASAVLAVTTPHMCGMGGDLFALVHQSGTPPRLPACLNASGRAGSGADPERLRREGHATLPLRHDIRAVTVPGCVDGWLALHARFGRLSRSDVLEPARSYAAEGFPASPLLAAAVTLLKPVPGSEDLLGSGPLQEGELVRRPGVARTLSGIAEDGRTAFYQGDFGEGLLELAPGYLTAADLERGNADWVDPLSTAVLGHQIWTTPPNSQGYLTLLGLGIASGLPLPDDPDEPLWAHLLVESARWAGHDRPTVLHEEADVRPLLEADAVGRRRSAIDPAKRASVRSLTRGGGTIYLAAVDRDRTGVSLIQSNAGGFGCHLFEPRTGINLQNRGLGFSLERGHPAEYGPGKRPPHTLSPALITKPDGSLRAVVGTMGGDSQPQILLQVVTRLLRHGEAPGHAIGAPRWVLANRSATGFNTWTSPDGVVVQVERDGPRHWITGLTDRGHDVTVADPGHGFGHAHLIDVADDVLAGAADPRSMVGSATGY